MNSKISDQKMKFFRSRTAGRARGFEGSLKRSLAGLGGKGRTKAQFYERGRKIRGSSRYRIVDSTSKLSKTLTSKMTSLKYNPVSRFQLRHSWKVAMYKGN